MPEPKILDANGRVMKPEPPRVVKCPRCGAGPEHRRASAGFGSSVHPICVYKGCGYEFHDEEWQG